MTKLEMKQERVMIKSWLAANDYKVNKIVLGEWEANDPRFIEYKELRKQKILRLNSIESELGV